MKKFYESGKLAEKWVKNYCWNNHEGCIRYELAEQGKAHSDNMLPNGKIDADLVC